MEKTAIITDSNSGMPAEEAERYNVLVVPMPVLINGKEYFENVDIFQGEFFHIQKDDANIITTSQPSAGYLARLWKETLKEYVAIVYIPMSSGLSSSCQTAGILAGDYDGRVQVVDNHRISVTMYQSVLDACTLRAQRHTAAEIKTILEAEAANSSIYIMVDTLKYLVKGGRITPAAAAMGSLLHIKPVLQIQGGALDTYQKCRGEHKARKVMLEAMRHDLDTRFKEEAERGEMALYYSCCGISREEEAAWKAVIQEAFPEFSVCGTPLSMSIAVHIGPGALAIACARKI